MDPRLNSVHLEALPRREDYRRAREALLRARGTQTLQAENSQPVLQAQTLLEAEGARPAKGVKYLLMDKEVAYPLKVGLNTVGRLPDNDVVVADASVSRRHCAIVVHAGNGCELYDTASKNGTFLNGRKLEGAVRLNPGDEIRMCDRQLVFALRPDSASGAAPLPPEPPSDSKTQCA